MKKHLKILAVAFVGTLLLVSCNKKFKTTDSGLMYKFIEINKGAQQPVEGDILVATCKISLDDSLLAEVTEAQPLFTVTQSLFKGDLPEGLKMMHLGDKAIFAIEADSVHNLGQDFPPYYKPGTGMKLYYEIYLESIITRDSVMKMQAEYQESLRQQALAEKDTLAQYVKAHNLNGTPDEDGLYIIVNKKGNGPKVEIGREVDINYTGKLLNGKVFDTSNETIAKENNLYNPNRQYVPLHYKVGEMPLITGWEKGVINQPAGTKLTLVIPSSLGYGPRGAEVIPPNSPLIFEIEIVSVK